MKTTTNCNRAGKMATALFTVIVLGTSAWAQPNQNDYRIDDVGKSFERLESIMSSVEQAAKYTAPRVEYDEIQSALNRLELLAGKTEIMIMYKVPDEDQVHEIEYIVQENDVKLETRDIIALKTGYTTNK